MTSVATQTDDEVLATPSAATASSAATCAATPASLPVSEHVAPALVIEFIAPAPTVILPVPSQLLTSTSTLTGLVSPQFSGTAVEASAPQVVGSLLPLEEFDAPFYNQVHQEQIVT